MPERYLDSEVCPGIPFAERSMWINIVTMLWTFNIRATNGVDPNTGLPFKYGDSDASFCGDFSNAPFSFPVIFEPRSLRRAEVARREWAELEKNITVLMPGNA
ncbi:hypothetical protein C0992_010032 [Termitomyces sp. T32_za158]|nr:hypothetical protein C0992_010032 [Termitomyces sp. T32_za158]